METTWDDRVPLVEGVPAQLLVVRVHRALLCEELAGTAFELNLWYGRSEEHGVWWWPLVARTRGVHSSSSALGGICSIEFDVAFAFPWHPFLAPSMRLRLCKPSCPVTRAVSDIQFDVPFYDALPGRVRRELPLLASSSRRLGTLALDLELRSVPEARVQSLFQDLAEPEKYPHELDACWPTQMPMITQAEVEMCSRGLGGEGCCDEADWLAQLLAEQEHSVPEAASLLPSSQGCEADPLAPVPSGMDTLGAVVLGKPAIVEVLSRRMPFGRFSPHSAVREFELQRSFLQRAVAFLGFVFCGCQRRARYWGHGLHAGASKPSSGGGDFQWL